MTPPDSSLWSRNLFHSEQRTARRVLAIVEGLRDSLSDGQVGAVERVLHPGASMIVDSGGRASAPTDQLRDRASVARALLGLFGPASGSTASVVSANGAPALAFSRDGRVIAILTVRAKRHRAGDVWVVVNPDKLRHWNGT